MYKSYKIKLYPSSKQKTQIDNTIGCVRFLYNKMLAERIEVYMLLKHDTSLLYKYKYKTEKQYKHEFEFLSIASSRALQQSRIDLQQAYKNFFKGKGKVGFPKFKSKKKSTLSYREPQVNSCIQIQNNRIKLLKLGWVKFRGLSKKFCGDIKSVTIQKLRCGEYIASILVKQENIIKYRKFDNIIGIDLGIKEFATCSNGEIIHGIKEILQDIEKKIKRQQRHLSRKHRYSKRREKCRIKLAKLYQYRKRVQDHFFWHLSNKFSQENQLIVLESLNIKGMMKNKKLSHSIQSSSWFDFLCKLEQKACEYNTTIIKIDRWFPSSKLCSKCYIIKKDLTLSDRTYRCDCGLIIDRDINASINIRNKGLEDLSLEYSDNKHGEDVRPISVLYHSNGQFSMKCLQKE